MSTQTPVRVASSRGVSPLPESGPDRPGPSSGKKGADAAPKKSKKKLVIILLVVVLAAAAGAYVMLGKKPAKPGPPKPGAVVSMSDTTLNLTDGHFLKIKIALQTVVGAPSDLDTSKAADLLISEFSDQSMASLSTQSGRAAAKQDLLTKIEAAYPKQIMAIYFTEFVMQ
jgi:flagellar FliL protein